jgi:hypothetical protein
MNLSLRMEFEEQEEQQPEERGVAIYSKWAVLGFSVFFSPLIGGILLALNLRSAGYKDKAILVVAFSIAYQLVAGILLNQSGKDLGVLSLVSNIIGGGILAEFFYKKYFPDDDYEHKSIWKPLLIVLLITIPLAIVLRDMIPK